MQAHEVTRNTFTGDAATPGDRLPVAIIGAGPIGLAAAAHVLAKGETPLVLEAGGAVGASIRAWSHVRLFSPWKYLVDPVARGMLEAVGWEMPHPESLPTGGELITELLEPLAALPAIAPHVRVGHRVLAVTRKGMDKVKTANRETTPFELVVRRADGTTVRHLARAVIDASGTWTSPNPLGAGGLPAEGEAEHAHWIDYGIPDVLGRDRSRFAGRRTLVVGSGHSAFNAVLDLAALKSQVAGSEIVWAVRRQDVGLMFGGGRKDALEARGALGTRLHQIATDGTVDFMRGFRIERIINDGSGSVVVEAADGRRVYGVDRIIVAAGFRPDLSLAAELRLKIDPWLEAPEQLAPLIDPNMHSCGTVYPHGATELAHPEPNLYVVGMKSYGRAPSFLLLTGYEQIRSVVCALVGDEEGAKQVELVLPETGVCQTDLGAGGCCGTSDEAADAGVEEIAPGELVLAGAAALTGEVSERAVAGRGTKTGVAPTAGGCGCGAAPGAPAKSACCR